MDRSVGGNSPFGDKTYVEEGDDEEKGVVVPLMVNCGDWARIPTPLAVCWTKLIWKPWPVGQPLEGPSTVVEPLEVSTPCFKVMLTLGFFCCKERTVSECGFRLCRNAMETNHVGQEDREVGGVAGDGIPGDGLRLLAGIPGSTVGGAGNGEGQGGGGKEEDRGEGREGTHHCSRKGMWEGRKEGEGKDDGGEERARVGLLKGDRRTQPPIVWARRT